MLLRVIAFDLFMPSYLNHSAIKEAYKPCARSKLFVTLIAILKRLSLTSSHFALNKAFKRLNHSLSLTLTNAALYLVFIVDLSRAGVMAPLTVP